MLEDMPEEFDPADPCLRVLPRLAMVVSSNASFLRCRCDGALWQQQREHRVGKVGDPGGMEAFSEKGLDSTASPVFSV